MSALFGRTKGENHWTTEILQQLHGNVSAICFETIQTQFYEISPLDCSLTSAPQCIEILLAHRNTDSG